ncbi:MAG: 1-acyl-sn-glycerol-3-phosphate acyltransferase [Bacteroidales bacterium]|nr:1-acyl-sn-glycerol-3-phosphate acyltransferase [Bacteroidales bacterium]
MKKTYENDWRYYVLKNWCDATVRSLFSDIESEGWENVPTDGAVLMAPNHCNTLMDALVVLQDRKDATLFGARADVFRKPILNKFLRFLRILPIPRVRDGLQEVLHNRETMEEVIECLDHGMRYAMFAEGTHRPMHSLLPLKKGITRTALLANERFGGSKPVYIVPMGLEYEDYYRLQTSLKIRYGKPINVTEYVAAHADAGEAEIHRGLLGILKERIAGLITYLPDDESYEGRWALTKMASQEAAMAADESLVQEAAAFERQRKAAKLSSWSFAQDKPVFSLIVKLILSLLFLPFWIFSAVVSAPLWITAEHIVKGLKDKAFARTARFGVKLAGTPLMVILWALVFFLCLPFKKAFIAFIMAILSFKFFYTGINEGRILLSDIRLLFGHKKLKDTYARLAAALRQLRPGDDTVVDEAAEDFES